MTQEHFIIELFCRVDDMLNETQEHFQAKLSISELVTLGLLFALKGSSQHAFYRWIKQNWIDLFPALPERTRFFRRLKTHRQITEKFLDRVKQKALPPVIRQKIFCRGHLWQPGS